MQEVEIFSVIPKRQKGTSGCGKKKHYLSEKSMISTENIAASSIDQY